MGIKFGSNSSSHKDELHSTIDWLNKQDVAVIRTWLLSLDNKRTAIRISSSDDDFIIKHVSAKLMFEIFRILPFAKTQQDWVKDHPRSTVVLLWYFEDYR